MKDTEIINFYNNLDQYAKDKIDRQLIDLTNAKKESRNYCIKVCPKCGAVDPGFTEYSTPPEPLCPVLRATHSVERAIFLFR